MDIDVIYEIARWLRIPPNWLAWPDVIFWLIIPFILLWYAFTCLLDKIGVFKRATHVNKFIALGFAFFALPLGSISVVASIFIICWTKIGGWKGVIIGLVAGLILYFIVLPLLLSFIPR